MSREGSQKGVKKEEYNKLWFQIIKQKISNQSRVLSLLGCPGAEKIGTYAQQMKKEDIDSSESLAAKDCFQFYHEGLNRRNDDPVNSRLNYGYAVVRSAIARAIVTVGCHPAFGIHHNNQLNAFNPVDDLIEPFRALVDLVAHENMPNVLENLSLKISPGQYVAIVGKTGCGTVYYGMDRISGFKDRHGACGKCRT